MKRKTVTEEKNFSEKSQSLRLFSSRRKPPLVVQESREARKQEGRKGGRKEQESLQSGFFLSPREFWRKLVDGFWS